MRDRIYIIDLNTKMYEKPKYKQYDNDIPFRFRIVENGVDVALAGYTVRAFFDNKRNVIQKNCTVRDRIIETKLDNNILAYEGEVKVEITLTKESQIITTFTITIEVEKSINRNSAVELDPGWDIIKDFQTTLDNAIKKAETNIKNTIDKVERDIENTITEANRDIENAINKAEEDVTNAINNIPPKSELVGAKGVSMRLKGPWSSSIAYVNDGSYIDLVTSGGNTYACKISHTNQPVSNTTYWELISKKGDKGDTGAMGPIGPQGRPGEEYIHPSTHPATMITEDELHRFLTDIERTVIQAWEDFKANGGEISGTITYPKGITRQIQQIMNLREKDYIQRMGVSNYNGYPCWSVIIEDPTNAENTNGLLFMLGSGVEGDAYRDNYVRPLKMGYIQRNYLGSPNVPWDDVYLRGVSKRANGYTKLPNGMLLQWGRVTCSATSYTTVTFPISFNTECLNVSLTKANTGASYDPSRSSLGQKMPGYMTINHPSSAQETIEWIAIGY